CWLGGLLRASSGGFPALMRGFFCLAVPDDQFVAVRGLTRRRLTGLSADAHAREKVIAADELVVESGADMKDQQHHERPCQHAMDGARGHIVEGGNGRA